MFQLKCIDLKFWKIPNQIWSIDTNHVNVFFFYFWYSEFWNIEVSLSVNSRVNSQETIVCKISIRNPEGLRSWFLTCLTWGFESQWAGSQMLFGDRKIAPEPYTKKNYIPVIIKAEDNWGIIKKGVIKRLWCL